MFIGQVLEDLFTFDVRLVKLVKKWLLSVIKRIKVDKCVNKKLVI